MALGTFSSCATLAARSLLISTRARSGEYLLSLTKMPCQCESFATFIRWELSKKRNFRVTSCKSGSIRSSEVSFSRLAQLPKTISRFAFRTNLMHRPDLSRAGQRHCTPNHRANPFIAIYLWEKSTITRSLTQIHVQTIMCSTLNLPFGNKC